jgi:hypothetical protein
LVVLQANITKTHQKQAKRNTTCRLKSLFK